MRGWVKRMRKAFIELMFKPAHVAIVALLGMYTTVWGFWIGSPFWETFTTAKVYANMLGAAPEISWGCTALLIGILVCAAAASHSYVLNRLGGGLLFSYWSVVAIMYLTSDWHNTGGITAVFLAIYGAYIFINSKLNRELFRPYGKDYLGTEHKDR